MKLLAYCAHGFKSAGSGLKGGSWSPGTVEHSLSTIGKNSAVPFGTRQFLTACASRTPGPVGNARAEPGRNQTFPDWLALQSAVSKTGLAVTGIENCHCQNFAANS